MNKIPYLVALTAFVLVGPIPCHADENDDVKEALGSDLKEYYKLAYKMKGHINDVVHDALGKVEASPKLDEIDKLVLDMPMSGTSMADSHVSIWTGGSGGGDVGGGESVFKIRNAAEATLRSQGASNGQVKQGAGGQAGYSSYSNALAGSSKAMEEYSGAKANIRTERTSTLGAYVFYKQGRWKEAAEQACRGTFSPINPLLRARAERKAQQEV